MTRVCTQALEVLFATGQGTPNKLRIKEIAEQLLEFGPITETNVYNWFQNRKVRTAQQHSAYYNDIACYNV